MRERELGEASRNPTRREVMQEVARSVGGSTE